MKLIRRGHWPVVTRLYIYIYILPPSSRRCLSHRWPNCVAFTQDTPPLVDVMMMVMTIASLSV